MKTNNKEVKKAIQAHILTSVYDCKENEFSNLKDACNHLNNEFIVAAGYENNLKRFPNNVDRFIDYLRGIPFHFHYTNEDLEIYLNSLGINPDNKIYSSDKMWNLYGLLIYREMIKNI